MEGFTMKNKHFLLILMITALLLTACTTHSEVVVEDTENNVFTSVNED